MLFILAMESKTLGLLAQLRDLPAIGRGETTVYYHIALRFSYTVTVCSTDENEPLFRGVLLQGRTMTDDSPAGTFEATSSLLRLSNCTPNEVSHAVIIETRSVCFNKD